jgi:hypothetical protein
MSGKGIFTGTSAAAGRLRRRCRIRIKRLGG